MLTFFFQYYFIPDKSINFFYAQNASTLIFPGNSAVPAATPTTTEPEESTTGTSAKRKRHPAKGEDGYEEYRHSNNKQSKECRARTKNQKEDQTNLINETRSTLSEVKEKIEDIIVGQEEIKFNMESSEIKTGQIQQSVDNVNELLIEKFDQNFTKQQSQFTQILEAVKDVKQDVYNLRKEQEQCVSKIEKIEKQQKFINEKLQETLERFETAQNYDKISNLANQCS